MNRLTSLWLSVTFAVVATMLAPTDTHAAPNTPTCAPMDGVDCQIVDGVYIFRVNVFDPRYNFEMVMAHDQPSADGPFTRERVIDIVSRTPYVDRQPLLAINADYFGDFGPIGLIVKQEKRLPNAGRNNNDEYWHSSFSLAIDRQMRMGPQRDCTNEDPGGCESWIPDADRYFTTFGGGPLFIADGRKLQAFPVDTTPCTGERINTTYCTARRAWSAIAIAEDGRTLLIAASSEANGKTMWEMSDILLDAGAERAMKLDGGSSTQLWYRDGGMLINSSRPIANALLIFSSPENCDSFCDVTTDSKFGKEIAFLKDAGIVVGFSDGLFHPDASITRSQTASMLWRWLAWDNQPSVCNADYPDLPTDGPHRDDIVYLSCIGVIKGFSDGTFRPQAAITRAQAVTMIVRILQKFVDKPILTTPVGEGYAFPDLQDGPHKDDVERARKIGLIHGYSDGTFRPETPVSRAQFAKIVARAIYYAATDNSVETLPTEIEDYSPALPKSTQSTRTAEYQNEKTDPDIYCFPAAAGASIPGITVDIDNTPVCYWRTVDEYHILTDVPPEHWARTHIQSIFNAGITAGCDGSDRRFCPEGDLTRTEAIVMLLRARHFHLTGQPGSAFLPPAATQQIFDDVPLNHSWVSWINHAYSLGITQGSPDCGAGKNFCPDAPVTRLHMALFLLRARDGQAYVDNLPHALGIFEDVPAATGHAAAMEYLYWQGITNGSPDCGDGFRYCPSDVVNRAHAAVFLTRTFVNPPIPTKRMGDLCFSTSSGYSIPRSDGGEILSNVDDEDIVCYHRATNRFKMYFNGSANSVSAIDIDALSLPQDGEIWFSTSAAEDIPGVGAVDDADVLIYADGVFRRELVDADMTGMDAEDIDALHANPSGKLYLSTTSSAQVPWGSNAEDVIQYDRDSGEFQPFFDAGDMNVMVDTDAVAVLNDESGSTIFISFEEIVDISTSQGFLNVGPADIVRFAGNFGENTLGTFGPSLCFRAQDHQGLESVDIDGLHVSNHLPCQPSPSALAVPAVLSVSETHLVFQGGASDISPAMHSFKIENTGEGEIYWSLQPDADWITVSTDDGEGERVVEVSVDMHNLSGGTYLGYINVDAPATQDGFQRVGVVLVLSEHQIYLPSIAR